jgi:hypothetical protein
LVVSPIDHAGLYNGPFPTLIPELCKLRAAWMDAWGSSMTDAALLLGEFLDSCPAVTDERIVAAIDLAVTSRYDSLPRSIFLSQLTIIDSLASRGNRTTQIRGWLDEKFIEAKAFQDAGLLSALANLKQESHGSAIKNLVGRAARAMGEIETQITKRQTLAKQLYDVRSGLSHAGSSLPHHNVAEARELATFVIEAAIKAPNILDVL